MCAIIPLVYANNSDVYTSVYKVINNVPIVYENMVITHNWVKVSLVCTNNNVVQDKINTVNVNIGIFYSYKGGICV
jgi:hypothetical protein